MRTTFSDSRLPRNPRAGPWQPWLARPMPASEQVQSVQQINPHRRAHVRGDWLPAPHCRGPHDHGDEPARLRVSVTGAASCALDDPAWAGSLRGGGARWSCPDHACGRRTRAGGRVTSQVRDGALGPGWAVHDLRGIGFRNSRCGQSALWSAARNSVLPSPPAAAEALEHPRHHLGDRDVFLQCVRFSRMTCPAPRGARGRCGCG